MIKKFSQTLHQRKHKKLPKRTLNGFKIVYEYYVRIRWCKFLRQRSILLFEYMLHHQKYHPDLNYYYIKLFIPPLRRTLISLVNLDQWGSANLFSKEVAVIHNHILAKGELVCLKCVDQLMKESSTDNEKTERICLRCVSSGLDSKYCVEWNCAYLYSQPQKINDSWKTIIQKGQQLQIIKKILSF